MTNKGKIKPAVLHNLPTRNFISRGEKVADLKEIVVAYISVLYQSYYQYAHHLRHHPQGSWVLRNVLCNPRYVKESPGESM